MKDDGEGLFEWARSFHHRADDPDTSLIAELALKEESVQAMLRMDLFAHARHREGLTDEEVRAVLKELWPSLTIHDRNDSKRCSDLEIHCGYLEDSGKRRLNSTGRPAKVRRITAEGLTALKSTAPLKRKPRRGVQVDLKL
jgi:hypothetical protein